MGIRRKYGRRGGLGPLCASSEGVTEDELAEVVKGNCVVLGVGGMAMEQRVRERASTTKTTNARTNTRTNMMARTIIEVEGDADRVVVRAFFDCALTDVSAGFCVSTVELLSLFSCILLLYIILLLARVAI
jgi:hypothetical protein